MFLNNSIRHVATDRFGARTFDWFASENRVQGVAQIVTLDPRTERAESRVPIVDATAVAELPAGIVDRRAGNLSDPGKLDERVFTINTDGEGDIKFLLVL